MRTQHGRTSNCNINLLGQTSFNEVGSFKFSPGSQEVKGVLLLDEKFSVKIPPGLTRGLLIENRER